jgi:lysozyme family protein
MDMLTILGIMGVLLLAAREGKDKDSFIKWVRKWEGGLSKAKTDTASANCAPGTQYHTNKGIQWVTYKSYCQAVKRTATTAEFLKMPDDLWKKIFDTMYWNKIHCDEIAVYSPSVAYAVFGFAWGSGVGGANQYLANFQRKYMHVDDDNIGLQELANNFVTSGVLPSVMFANLCEFKRDLYRSFNQPANLKGWLNRIDDFEKTFAPTI